jgi:hypothetical protein
MASRSNAKSEEAKEAVPSGCQMNTKSLTHFVHGNHPWVQQIARKVLATRPNTLAKLALPNAMQWSRYTLPPQETTKWCCWLGRTGQWW